MDYIGNLHLQNDFQMKDLTKSLSQLESEIIKDASLKDFNKETTIIQKLFTIAGNIEYKMPKERWDIIRFNIYTFIAAHTPNNRLIPDFSIVAHTAYGPLFYVLTILSIMNIDNQKQNFIMDCFSMVKDKILNEEETSPYKFYSITSATFTNLLPTITYMKFKDKVLPLFKDFFNNLKSKIDECEKKLTNPMSSPSFNEISPHSVQISFHTHLFFLELLRNMMKPHRNEFNESSIIMIHTLWFNAKASSTLLPQYINFINHILLNEKNLKVSFPYDIDRIAKMLANNSRFRHNDIFKMLSPVQIFEFFNRATSNDRNKNKYTLRFICQFLFADNQREIFLKMRLSHDDNPNSNNPNREDFKFIPNQIQHYLKGHARFSLLFFLEQLSSSFGCLTGLLKQIKAIKIGPAKQSYRYFSEQVRDKSDLTELDDLLYSKYEFVSYDNKEDALKACEKCFKYIEIFHERSTLPFSFFQKLLESTDRIHDHDVKNQNIMSVDGSNSSLFFNVRRVFTSFFTLIVEIAYRYMLLSQFLFSDVCLMPQVNRCYSKCSRFDLNDVRGPIKKISEILNKPELSDQVLQSYAKIISDILFQAVKERHVTNQLVSYLYLFNSPDSRNPRDARDSRLYQMIINNMIQFAYSSTYYIDELNVEDANNWHQYLLLILNMGRKLRSNLPSFMTNLRQYQKSFITIMLNRFRCTNQREFLNSMIQYIKLLNDNNDETKLQPDPAIIEELIKKKNPLAQARIQMPFIRYAMTDYRKELKSISTHLILDKTVIYNVKPNIKQLIISYLTCAFQSSDANLINKALNNALPSLLNTTKPDLIKDNQQLFFDDDSDNFRPFYTSLFKSLLKSSREDSLKVISTIPQLLSLFNCWKANVSARQIGFIIPRYQVDLFNILNNILFHFSGKEMEAINILMFLNTLINDPTFSQGLDKLPIQIIDLLIMNLTGLFGYKVIRQKVISLFKILHKKFLPVVANGNYDYIWSLFFNVQLSYSEANSLYVKVIEMFFNDANIPDSPTFNAARIIQAYFNENRTIINYNEFLVFLMIIQNKWPGSIPIDVLHLFLLSLTINNPFMIQHTKPEIYSKPFNEFIKSFISNLRKEQISGFLLTIIFSVESNKLPFMFKRVIFKRLSKGHFPTPFKNFNHISPTHPDKETFFIKLYLVLLLGVQSNEPVPDEIFRRSIEEMKKICKNETVLSSSLLCIIIYFIQAIYIKQPDSSRYFNDDIHKLFLNIIIMASVKLPHTDSFRKEALKCLKFLKERAQPFYERIMNKEIMNVNLGNINSNPNYAQNLKNIIRNAYLFPECIQKEHIQAMLHHLIEFTKYPYEQKIKQLNQAMKFVHFLTLPDYNSSYLLREFLMSEYEDHLSYFAYIFHIFILMLYEPSYVSFYTFFDSIQLFLNKFKKETIEVVINHNFIDEIENSYDLLYNLTIGDETDEFFNFILEKFDELSRADDKTQMNQMAGSNNPSQPHIAAQHPAFFNLLYRLTKTERFSKYPDLGERILRYFYSVMFDKRQADNKMTVMNILIDSAFEALKKYQTKDQIILITNYIATSGVNTYLYRKWKEVIFKNRERKFYVQYFVYFLTNYKKTPNYEIIEIILVQLLKGLKSLKKGDSNENDTNFNDNEYQLNLNSEMLNDIDLNELFLNEMKNMIANPEMLSCAMGCFVVYFKYNKPDSHNLPIALSGFGPSLAQPNPYCIIHVFKIAIILLGDMYYYNNLFNNQNNFNNNDDKNDNKEEEDDDKIDSNDNRNYNNYSENNVYLPLPVLADLIQHVLYFQKFLDLPFTPYVGTIFRNANKLFNKNNIPDSLADCFKQFVILKVVRCKELEKVACVIQMMPVLVEVIPFSLVYSIFHNIDLCAQNKRNNSFRIDDNFNVISFAIKYMQKNKLTEDEESYIFKFCFNFLGEIFKGDITHMKPNIEMFLRPLMPKAKYMPPDLLDIVNLRLSKDDKIPIAMKFVFAVFAVLSTEAVDANILLKNSDFIIKSFETYIQKMSQYLRIYVQSIFNRPELSKSCFVDHFFRVLQNHQILEIRLQLLRVYISTSDHPDKLKYLSFFWNKDLQPVHFQQLSGHIENLPIHQQSAYLNLILEKTKSYRNVLHPVFITNFINSKKVENPVKSEFLQKLPLFIDEFDGLFISKLYEAIQTLEFDTFKSQLLLLFYSLVKTNDSSRLLYYQKLKELSGDSEENRFITLTEAIPASLWTNKNLTFISFIIIDSKRDENNIANSLKMDLPLVMLSDMFDSFSSDFMTNILIRIINERTISTVHKLLTECLAEQLRQQEHPPSTTRNIQTPQQRQRNQKQNNQASQAFDYDKYQQIITAITRSFHHLQISIQPVLMYKSLKLSNDFSLFSCLNKNYYSMDNINDKSSFIPEKLLLPHKVNDIIFSSVMTDVSFETLSASAQFFLGNYEEAERMFNASPCVENKVAYQLQQISSDIVNKMRTNDSLSKFSIFNRFNHDDMLLVPSLEHAYLPDKSNENNNNYKLEQLSRAEQCNVLYFKHHPHLSYYERERLSAIECVIVMMRNKLRGSRQAATLPSVATQPQMTNPIQVPVPVPINVSTPLTQPVLSGMPSQQQQQQQQQQPQPAPMLPQIEQQQQMQMGRMNMPITSPQQPPQQYRSPQMPRQMPMMPPPPPPQQPPPPPPPQQQQMIRLQQQQQRAVPGAAPPMFADQNGFKVTPSIHYIIESCLPPQMAKFVIDFSHDNSKEKPTWSSHASTQQSPFVVLPSEFRPFFSDMSSHIEPADFHGFFAIDSTSLFTKFSHYLTNLPKTAQQQHQQPQHMHSQSHEQQQQMMMSTFDQFLWPSLCFNIFASSEKSSDVLFKVTLDSYLRLLTEERVTNPNQRPQGPQPMAAQQMMQNNSILLNSPMLTIPPFLCLAASARAINLFNYSLSNQFENQQLLNAAVKSCDLIVPDQTTPQLKPWMPQIVGLRNEFPPIFSERTEPLTSSYSHIATTYSHKMQIKEKSDTKKIIFQLDFLSHICDLVLNISDEAFEKARAKKKLSSNAFVSMDDLDLDDLSEEEKKFHKMFYERIRQLNQRMPFEYDRRSPFLIRIPIKIIRLYTNFAKLSDNVITFSAVTVRPHRQRFVVERVESTDNAVTFSNVLEGVKNIFKYSFPSRTRNIRLTSHPAMELGPNLIMHLFPMDIIPLVPQKKNVKEEENNEKFFDVDFNENKNFDVDDKNKNNNDDKEISRGWLRRKMMSMYTQKDFFKMRRALVASFAAYSVARNMFSLDQPNPKNFFLSLNTAELPFIFGDFAIPNRFGETASLVTEELQLLFGELAIGEITLAVAAASTALAKHIDAVRSLVEVPLFGLFDTREKDLDIVLSKRDWIDSSILSLAPPLLTDKMKQNNDESNNDDNERFTDESVKWITNLNHFVTDSFKKFHRKLYDDDFIQTNKINMNINTNTDFDSNTNSNQNSASNSIGDMNSIFDLNDNNSKTNNNDNNNDSPFSFQSHDDDDQGFGNYDIDNNQMDDFDLF